MKIYVTCEKLKDTMKVALFGRTIGPSSVPKLAELLSIILSHKDVKVVVYRPFLEHVRSLGENLLPSDCQTFSSYNDLPADTGLLLSLGGDGTFLSSVPLIRDKKIPIAGINFGRLGFLTTSQTANGMEKLLTGNFKTESRNLLKMEYSGMPEGFYPFALNEFSIQRNGPAVLELEIRVNGTAIPRYMADGVLIATSTGSTAYSMSAGGPIVMPGCRVLIIVPVAPHNLNIRPLVVPDSSIIEVSFSTRYANATLSADNRSFPIPNGSTIKFTSSDSGVILADSDNDFVQALSRKLYWGADWRNTV